MPTTEERKRAKLGIKARNMAQAELIASHRAEFDALHAKHRTALGLSPRASGPTRAELEERIKKQEERLAKWKEELRLAG